MSNYPKTCDYGFKRSWVCLFERGHDGPCGLIPHWWNWAEDARRYRRKAT